VSFLSFYPVSAVLGKKYKKKKKSVVDIKLQLCFNVVIFSGRNVLGAFMTSEKSPKRCRLPIFAAVLLSALQRIDNCAS
jgi:hypothetical protein